MNQVQIYPTKLSILSINRSKYWIFKSAMLELLHVQASDDLDSVSEDGEDEEDYENDVEGNQNDGEEEEAGDDLSSLNDKLAYLNRLKRNSLYDMSNSSYSPKSSGKKKHGSILSTSSFNEKEIDNSSKEGKDLNSNLNSRSNSNNNSNSNSIIDISKQDVFFKKDSNNSYNNSNSNDDDNDEENNYFFHIAFTPIECTVICSSYLMEKYFLQPLEICQKLGYDDIKLVDEKFVNLQIDSGGNDNKRILKLTKPLSDNNIPLFFLSSHYSDIVLIPHSLENKVINILTNNNFEFNDISGSYIINSNTSYFDRAVNNGEEGDEEEPNLNSPFNDSNLESLKILETKTFELFKDSNIKPIINKDIKLLLTGCRSSEVNKTILKTVNNISKNNIPNYFAITRTSNNEVSLILPKNSKKRSKLGFNSKFLIGSTQDIINPITVDLTNLPIDSTGIVAGMSSKIINGVNSFPNEYPFELNYLSMARSAILLIPEENIELVGEILQL